MPPGVGGIQYLFSFTSSETLYPSRMCNKTQFIWGKNLRLCAAQFVKNGFPFWSVTVTALKITIHGKHSF